MKRNLIYIMVCATTLLSSCHIYKAYDRPKDIKTDGVYRSATSDNEAMATDDTTSIGNLPWKEVFKDPYLQTLIEKGLANNVNMQAAILRVDEAKALLLSARLAYVPSLNLNATGTLSSYDGAKPSKIYSVPASASWQVDLFGSLLNASRAAKASLLQTDAYRQAVRSSLIANIANTYYTLLMLDRQVNITEQTSKIWKENVRAMEAMKEAGMTTEAAVLQSQANSHSIEASLADLRRQVRETENAMATMLGEAPHAIERGTLENQQLPDNLTVGVPLQLLSNRPDVKQAEMTLANAYYTTNQARAAFYPSITITGSAAWTNSSGMGIVNPGKILLTALGQLSQPIFNHGKLIANLKVTKDEEKIAQMNYQQSILDAGREVSNALYLYNAATDKLTAHNAQAASLTKAVTYTQDLFHSGEATYLEILTAQQSLLGAQLNEVSDSFQRMQAVIDLYNALGGGRD
jgi:multidrug efflux system outer membrane protein